MAELFNSGVILLSAFVGLGRPDWRIPEAMAELFNSATASLGVFVALERPDSRILK